MSIKEIGTHQTSIVYFCNLENLASLKKCLYLCSGFKTKTVPDRVISDNIIMADRRSTYVFNKAEDYEDARNHLYREMNSDYNDSNCIYFYGWWGSCSRFDWDSCYRIDIYSNCSDAPRVANILREHCGRYYDM